MVFGFLIAILFLSSNISSGPSDGVYSFRSGIRYARCCSHHDDFRYHHKCLVDRLLSQGYIALRLEKSFKKFYGRYQDLIEKYQRSVNVMVNDSSPDHLYFTSSRSLVAFVVYMDSVETFNISLDLSTIYFAYFSGCGVSFVYSCHSIVERYNLFSAVKLSIRSLCFILPTIKSVAEKSFDVNKTAIKICRNKKTVSEVLCVTEQG